MLNYISRLPSANFATTWPRRLVVLGSTGSIGQNALSVLEGMPGYFSVLALAGGRNVKLLAAQALRWRPACLAVQDEECARTLAEELGAMLKFGCLDDQEVSYNVAGLQPAQGYRPEIFTGQSGYAQLAALSEADMVLSAQSGAAGLWATYTAIKAGKVVALANKESLVLAGDIIRGACAESGASLLPVDSEHNAIFQCLIGQNGLGLVENARSEIGDISSGLPHTEIGLPEFAGSASSVAAAQVPEEVQPVGAGSCSSSARSTMATNCGMAAPSSQKAALPIDCFQPSRALKKIILTASGGPFRGRSATSLRGVSKAEALAHPTWNMGAKITIDSATMMNKGLEFVEACHLFGLAPEQVEVLVHPQSIIHSIVEYQDNSRLAQLGVPDMRIPISCCLGWPYRLDSRADELDLTRGELSFLKPDLEAFPALAYWKEAHANGRGLSVALNAANEVAVDLFMEERLSFTGISALARRVMDAWDESSAPGSIEDVLGMDGKARALARKEFSKMK